MLKENQIWITSNQRTPCLIIIEKTSVFTTSYYSGFIDRNITGPMSVSTDVMTSHLNSNNLYILNGDTLKRIFYQLLMSPDILKPNSPFINALKNSAKAE